MRNARQPTANMDLAQVNSNKTLGEIAAKTGGI